jgi:putative N-acetyltransferase (TIGR04045 family)
MSCAAGMKVDVIGAVRIYEEAPGVWFGSRLAVDPDWRGIGGLAARLIRSAVCTAHSLGAHTFLARVQTQNVTMFRRLRWRSLGEELVCGREHQLMTADLSHYPATESLDVPR